MMRTFIALLLAAGWLVVGGCDAARWTSWTLFGGTQKTVKAEYRIPHDSTVAVLIYVDRDVQYEYPDVTLTLGSQIAERMKLLLTRSHSVKVVNPRTVARYQDNNVRWDSQSKATLAEDLNADYVLFVTLPEYSLREPGAMSLYQARIIAEAKLYDAKDPYDDPVWESEDTFHVVHPREGTYEGGRVGQIRYEAEQKLAEKIVRCFTDYKAPYDNEDEFDEEGL